MMNLIPVFICIAVLARLLTLAYSRRNEARLRAAGAVEFAPVNTQWLAIAHVAYYVFAVLEYWLRQSFAPAVMIAGGVLWFLAMLALIVVMMELRELWTVKVLISPQHVFRRGSFYRFMRHPNYVLNIIPELIGFALATNAWLTLVFGLPVYLVILYRRVQAEESAMRSTFAGY